MSLSLVCITSLASRDREAWVDDGGGVVLLLVFSTKIQTRLGSILRTGLLPTPSLARGPRIRGSPSVHQPPSGQNTSE